MKRLVALAAVLGALAAPALAHASAPPTIARPNPVTYEIRLDYVQPLTEPDGGTAAMPALEQGVIAAAMADKAALTYEKLDDLGGFGPAAVGRLTLTTGGHDVLPPGRYASQIPLFAQSADGAISSYLFMHPPTGPAPRPDNGEAPGILPPPPPTPGNAPPPANQGFGGRPTGGGNGGGKTSTGGTTTRKRRPPPKTTTTTSTTTSIATVPVGTTTTVAGGGGGGGGGGSGGCTGGSCSPGACGTPGISIDSSIPGCTLTIATASPGDSASETFTIQNTSGSTYTLSFMASGANNNHLWQDLEMDVYDPSGGVPTPPLPPLTSWLGSFHVLTTLNPGQIVQYVVELYLPTTAGNADQGESATVDFTWSAS